MATYFEKPQGNFCCHGKSITRRFVLNSWSYRMTWISFSRPNSYLLSFKLWCKGRKMRWRGPSWSWRRSGKREQTICANLDKDRMWTTNCYYILWKVLLLYTTSSRVKKHTHKSWKAFSTSLLGNKLHLSMILLIRRWRSSSSPPFLCHITMEACFSSGNFLSFMNIWLNFHVSSCMREIGQSLWLSAHYTHIHYHTLPS